MITLTTQQVTSFLKSMFPEEAKLFVNGAIDKSKDKSIGVFLASDARSTGNLDIGGIDATSVRMLPVNIMIRYGTNTGMATNVAVRMYDQLLLHGNNFEYDGVSYAYIQLIDGCPVSIGRDDRNVYELSIRANFYYYIKEDDKDEQV